MDDRVRISNPGHGKFFSVYDPGQLSLSVPSCVTANKYWRWSFQPLPGKKTASSAWE